MSPDLLQRALGSVRAALATVQSTKEGSEYQNSGLVGQCQFIESVLLMNKLTADDAQLAMSLWKRVPKSGGHLPARDIAFLLRASEAIGQSTTATLVESLIAYGRNDSNTYLRDRVILTHSASLLERALASIQDTTLTDRDKWERLIAIVPAAIARSAVETAAEALENLHELAIRGSCTSLAHVWFSQESNYDAIWDAEDALWARAQIAHCEGDLVECGQLLARLFWSENHRDPESAREILSLMADWRVSDDLRNHCENGLARTSESEVAPDSAPAPRSKPCRIVFVGGNETQERYDESIRREIAADLPNVEILFFHTGWSANWGRELPTILSAAHGADAVVIMQFIRTMLGRRLRSQLSKPWVACTGHGRDAIIRSTRRAVDITMRRRPAA